MSIPQCPTCHLTVDLHDALDDDQPMLFGRYWPPRWSVRDDRGYEITSCPECDEWLVGQELAERAGLPGDYSWRLDAYARDRLAAKLVKDGECIIWTGTILPKGYGQVRLRGRSSPVYVHRLAYELAHGPIPHGLQVDHLCRRRACCNPDHLELVTNAENSRRGSKAKLTQAKADEIRRRSVAGERRAELAKEFGVSTDAVDHVVHRRRWA